MIYFIAALYNEADEIQGSDSLFYSVADLVDGFRIVDDGSTDGTDEILDFYWMDFPGTNIYKDFRYKTIPHTGLPETVKNEALKMVPDESWVLMLDADERLTPETIAAIKTFMEDEESYWDYVYFNQQEIIDNVPVRNFQKAKLFRKESITFPLDNIHADDQFTGRGTFKEDWIVLHRKTTYKQIKRETEYLETYKRLLDEGKIDEGRYNWLVGLHHFIRPT